MKNPWEGINKSPFYTVDDKRIIDEFNDKLKGKKESPFFIDLNLMPEPYIGDPKANVILLFTNPGLKGNEKENYETDGLKDALIKNLTHHNKDYPYYYLNPKFKNSDGGKWLRKRMKELIGDNEDADKLISKKIFTLQLHPYHSKKFKDFNFKNTLSVDSYTQSLFKNSVEKAKNNLGIIICIRSYDEWNKRYKKIYGDHGDLKTDLKDNFIKLKTPNTDKTPRTPYFKKSFFKEGDFEKLTDWINK